ncbi:MAG: ribose-phosphate pyrophosphokinase [Eubacterium sp.]|jgi:ribose-phosphate pyrophosphokinase|nr:ribose-phosphate pyrophosphokinase [Eubacterium sp.]
MNLHGKDIKIFAANSNPTVALGIATKLGLPLCESDVSTFSDGEISLSIHESVRGSDVFVVQSTSQPVNDHLMELLIMIDAFKRASAGRITAVMPYYGYARQDRKAKARDAISAKLVADLLTVAGADRLLTMDLHSPQIQGFFDIPLDHLQGISILAPYFKERVNKNPDEYICVSPDLGSVTRARSFSHKIGTNLAIIDKKRQKANTSEVMNIIGNVKDKRVIIVDDMIDTAGTLCNSANAVIELGGAKEVFACATHGVLSGHAVERIRKSYIKELVLLDTISIPNEKILPNMKILKIENVFAQAIERIYSDKPVSPLFI